MFSDVRCVKELLHFCIIFLNQRNTRIAGVNNEYFCYVAISEDILYTCYIHQCTNKLMLMYVCVPILSLFIFMQSLYYTSYFYLPLDT